MRNFKMIAIVLSGLLFLSHCVTAAPTNDAERVLKEYRPCNDFTIQAVAIPVTELNAVEIQHVFQEAVLPDLYELRPDNSFIESEYAKNKEDLVAGYRQRFAVTWLFRPQTQQQCGYGTASEANAAMQTYVSGTVTPAMGYVTSWSVQYSGNGETGNGYCYTVNWVTIPIYS